MLVINKYWRRKFIIVLSNIQMKETKIFNINIFCKIKYLFFCIFRSIKTLSTLSKADVKVNNIYDYSLVFELFPHYFPIITESCMETINRLGIQ